MNRIVIIGGLVVVAGLAVAVYRAKLGAEETQGRIDDLKAEAARVEKDIAVMRAEEAYLTRPERIGPIARERLGLEQAAPDQYVATEALKQRLGEERLTLPAPDAEPSPEAPPPVVPAQQ
jgi:cell division protein FtsL